MCLTLLNAVSMFGQKCIARNSPVAICATKQSPSNDPKFHQPLIVDGVGRSTSALFAILNRGCLFLWERMSGSTNAGNSYLSEYYLSFSPHCVS